MNRMKTWARRVRYYVKNDFCTVENMVLFFAIVLCLVWTYQSITAMSRNWELSEKLTAEKKELELLRVETEAAELENEYFRSNEYQELLARKHLDKQVSGEKMVVLPQNSEEAKNRHNENDERVAEKKVEYSNMEKWLNFLFPNY
ncbi:hypothetical protein IJG22_00345 [Candidatus Saccharibacteria bacterium]|nr:hypothetical protein [Candidatus Saccharibacteria bacterium]